jgi:hypothetical protein
MEVIINGVAKNGEETMANKVTKDGTEGTPTALPPDVMNAPEPSPAAVERPLHLRVLAEMIDGQVDQTRVEKALTLAQEVYELELASVSLENYRSRS